MAYQNSPLQSVLFANLIDFWPATQICGISF